MGRRPTAEEHIKELRKKWGARSWILRHLKRVGISQARLALIYSTMIRPVLEYPAVAFHSILPAGHSDSLERLQSISLRTIYGFDCSYQRCLELSGFETLKQRRESLFNNFARRASEMARFGAWFPRKDESSYGLRRQDFYQRNFALRDRLRNLSLIHI